MTTWEELEDEITAWQAVTFPQATARSTATHLHRETGELLRAIESGAPLHEIAEEWADCWFMLNAVRAMLPRTPEQARADVIAKFAKNRARRWKAPDADGVVEHDDRDDVVGHALEDSTPNPDGTHSVTVAVDLSTRAGREVVTQAMREGKLRMGDEAASVRAAFLDPEQAVDAVRLPDGVLLAKHPTTGEWVRVINRSSWPKMVNRDEGGS